MRKVAVVLSCIIAVMTIVMLCLQRSTATDNIIDTTSSEHETVEAVTEESTTEDSVTEESTIVVTIPESTEETTPWYHSDNLNRFNNDISESKGVDSYVSAPQEALNRDNSIVDVVDKYEYSNGFVVQDTENIRVATYGFNDGKLYGVTENTIINVNEEDPSITTIQDLRSKTLEMVGMNYYVACDPIDIPKDAEVEIGVGLIDWKTYFQSESYKDPTIEDWCQILCDTVITTAFGNALYLEVYLPAIDKYTAYAFILCEGDRILNISIEDTSREYLWSYLIELTNDAITLIK